MSSKKQKPLNNFLLNLSPILKFKIAGHSMSPTLDDRQIVLVNRFYFFFKKPQVNDIIAANINGKIFIKRITKIKINNYFLSGDNKKDSIDSRKFGMISKRNIIGKVIFK